MEVYVKMVMILKFTVDFLLLLGTSRLSGFPPGGGRAAAAAALSGLYSGMCLRYPGLGGSGWHLAAAAAVAVTAFGWNRSTLRRGALFMLLEAALAGIALGLNGHRVPLTAAIAMTLLCSWGIYEKRSTLIPVELRYGTGRWKAMALRDTGNLLRDPLTGERVMVAGAELGKQILGLTPGQLESPAELLAQGLARGGRLIPYHSVGQPSGLLLALRLPEVRVGAWKGEALVAFSPAEFGSYQMLLGGLS